MTDEQFIETATSFLVPLRMQESIDEAAYQQFSAALIALADAKRGQPTVSKQIALVLVDIYPALLGIAAARVSAERDMLEDWAVNVLDKITNVLA
jgi:hypothetical protein